jgi:hypothetical protein
LARWSITAATTLAACLLSCASFEHLTQVSSTFPQAKECGKCHIDIYQEWSKSDHAGAYTNAHFQTATNSYAFDDCLSCHAPEPVLTANTPAVRSAKRAEGVTCVACHLEGGELCGPLEATGKVQPHPIGVRPDVYRDVGICGRCHEGTLQQWSAAAGEKRICQQCHMPEVVRKMTQSSGGFSNVIVAMEHETPQRRHVFAIPQAEALDEMFTVEIKRAETDVEVSLHNRLPHSLPTGDYGFRILVLELLATDNQGTEHSLTRVELAPEMKTHIPAFETWRGMVTVPADSVSLRIRLRRHSYHDQPVLDLLDRNMELGPHDAGK